MDFAELMNVLRNPQAMQARLEAIREKTARVQATGSAGGGMVRVTLNGELAMLSCEISPEAVDPKDVGLLQDLVRAAFNDAAAKVKEEAQRQLAGDLGLPGGMPIPPGSLGGL